MNTQLTINLIMKHAEKINGAVEIVSVTADNPRHRYTYRDAFSRVRRLANVLESLGLEQGDTVATIAWNDYRHLEIYYAVSCGGMICHTINPRLFVEQIKYIINDANDKWIFLDLAMVTLLEPLRNFMPDVKGFVVMTDQANMPETSLPNTHCYETLLAAYPAEFEWPELDENTPSALCYTSGTSGNPKGVMYTHRSTLLHCYAIIAPDVMGLSVNDAVLPIVPMFHVNGWGLVYAALMTGSKLVLPGQKMGCGETLCKIINEEKVTTSAGVPTVWLALLDYMQKSGKTVESLNRITVGGAACPFYIFDVFRKNYNVNVQHAWGMTEMNPLGTFNGNAPASVIKIQGKKYDEIRLKQGRPVFGVEMKIVDANNISLPWDGKTFGAVKVRGPWVIAEYYHYEDQTLDADGWFETGDVATIDKYGYLQITDRVKDVIKSGGEWISSIELENCAINHPSVAEAAVVGIPHTRWGERPLLLVILIDDAKLTQEEMLAWFDGKVVKWWMPENCIFVDLLPHTATGKLDKKNIRSQYSDYSWTN